MDSKIPEILSPMTYRLTQLRDHENLGPVLIALGVVVISYIIYSVRITRSLALG